MSMLGHKVNFKKARIPSKKKLNGKYCFLEPINSEKHSKDLFKNFSLDKKGNDWTYMPTGPYKTEKSLKTIMNIFIKGKLDYYKLDQHIPKFKRYPKGIK